MKKLVALLLAVLMVVCLFAGCAPKAEEPAADDAAPAASSKPVDAEGNEIGEIAYVAYCSTIPYWNDGIRGLEAAAKQIGLEFTKENNFYGPTGTDGNEQATIIEQLVAKGVSGLVVSPVDLDACVGACNAAMEKGIPVVCVINGQNDVDSYYAELGGSNYNVGVTGATYLAEDLGIQGKVGILTMPGVPVHEQRSSGYVDTLAKYDGIEVLPLVDTDGDPTIGLDAATAMIQANPDLVALIGTDSVGGAAAARAVQEAGKAGEIAVVGMDRDADLLGYIKDGIVSATVASRSFTTKFMAMYYIYWILTESIEDVASGISNLDAGLDPVPTLTDTSNLLITADNVDLFLDALEA